MMMTAVQRNSSLAKNRYLFSREALDCLKRLFDQICDSQNMCNVTQLINSVVYDNTLIIVCGEKRANQIAAAVEGLDHANAHEEYISYDEVLVRLNIEIKPQLVTPQPSQYELSLSEFRQRLQNVMKTEYLEPAPVSSSHSTFDQIAKRLERFTNMLLPPTTDINEVSNRITRRMEEKMEVASESSDEENRLGQLSRDRLHELSADEQIIVSSIFSPPYDNTIIIDKFNIDMSKSKLRCLMPNTWLNDEVINFYMCMLQERDTQLCAKNSSRRASHYFNSFFVNKLVDLDNRYNYNNIKR